MITLKFEKKWLWRILALVVGSSVIWTLIVGTNLSRRFPEMDFTKARFATASWYSETDDSINESTASGEEFDDKAMTCATQNYPFGKRLLIVNAMNGKYVVCRVNDRGPAKRLGRGVDLTRAAFKRIANLKRGLVRVTIIPSKE